MGDRLVEIAYTEFPCDYRPEPLLHTASLQVFSIISNQKKVSFKVTV